MTTRHETPADGPLITAVIHRAFAGHPHSRGTEAAIVHQRRTHGALTVSVVGELDGEVRGHGDGSWPAGEVRYHPAFDVEA